MKDVKKNEKKIECPIEKSISLIGSKWTLMIIRTLYLNKKPMHFNEILKDLNPISSKTLSSKLKELAKSEIIVRNVIPDTPVKIQYSLTEKGKDLNGMMNAMASWSLKWNI
jgi:DNA-binding HxlR family transcriptional regulator